MGVRTLTLHGDPSSGVGPVSPRTQGTSPWNGLRAWLSGGGGPGPAFSEWHAELTQLGASWRSEQRAEDLRGLSLLRRAVGLSLLLDDVQAGMPALLPRHGSDPRSSLERQFDVRDLETLAELVAEGAPAALRARVWDLRWILLGDIEAAGAAQRAYLEVAHAADLGRAAHATAAGEALLRAVRLSQEREDRTGIDAGLSELLPRALHADHPIALHRIVQAALLIAGPNRVSLADLSISRAETEIARRDFRWGRTFYGHAERALASAGREHESQTLGIVRATVLSDEARFLRHLGQPAWIAASFTQRAIDELRLVPDSSELVADLAREAGQDLRASSAPPGVERESGRLATAIEEVQRASDQLEPNLRACMLGFLPFEPEGSERFPTGPAVLDQFLRRFRARGRGRYHPVAWPETGVPASPGSDHVRAWVEGARDWLVPLIDALRRSDTRSMRERRAAFSLVLDEASDDFAARREALVEGVLACWGGDPGHGLGVLVPQLAHLRASVPVHRLLERAPALALVDAALLSHPEGLALTTLAGNDGLGRDSTGQAAADLALWWTLCLAALAE